MRGNQWICNNQLIEMLFWSTQTNATLFLDKTNTCDKSIPTGETFINYLFKRILTSSRTLSHVFRLLIALP